MQKAELTVGLVGAGFSASFHMANYRRVCGLTVRVKGLVARRSQRATDFARAHQLEETYGSVEQLMADPEIEVVDVCCPNSLHEAMAIQAAKAGKHIICEKPLTGYFGAEEAELLEEVPRERMLSEARASAGRISEAVARAGVKFCYAENWVYAPPIQKARRLLEQTDNTILRIVGEESHSGTHSPYAMRWKHSGGGSLLNKGCHPLGAALHLKYAEGRRKLGTPLKPRWITAEVGNLTRIESFVAEQDKFIRTGWQDCEDWGAMLLGFEDGSVAQITAGDTTLGGIHNVLRVLSSKAVIDCNINPNTGCVAYAPDERVFGQEYLREKLETKAGWNFTNPDEDWITGFPSELQDFCEAVVLDREPDSGIELATDVVAVCYAAYLAASLGRRVDLSGYLY